MMFFVKMAEKCTKCRSYHDEFFQSRDLLMGVVMADINPRSFCCQLSNMLLIVSALFSQECMSNTCL